MVGATFGIRTRNPRFTKATGDPHNDDADKNLEAQDACGAAPGAARDAQAPETPLEVTVGAQPLEAQTEAELGQVISRWKDLPEYIRAAILALVNTGEVRP